jgi:GNAT superfamily N-acetyltransferase
VIAAGPPIIDHAPAGGNERTPRELRTVITVPGSHATPPAALDAIVGDLIARIPPPLSLIPGPWPVPHGRAGVGDEALRALLADDWAGTRMSAAKLRKLIDTQLVSRHNELGADHPDGRDLGISVDGELVGRVLLDTDDEHPAHGPAIVLVDIAIRPDRQRQGIGGQVARALLATAAAQHHGVRATGVYGSTSLTWLLGLGLVDIGGDALYRQLIWTGA